MEGTQKEEAASFAIPAKSQVVSKEEHHEMAHQYAQQRNENFQRAAAAFRGGERGVAAYYAEEGRRYNEKMKSEHHKAAQRIVSELDPQLARDPFYVDLHGLRVNEALHLLKHVLHRWYQIPRKPLVVVTGSGKHSADQRAKIKPAVISYLTQQAYQFDADDGQVVVRGFA